MGDEEVGMPIGHGTRERFIGSLVCAATLLMCAGCAIGPSVRGDGSRAPLAATPQAPHGTPSPTVLYQSSLTGQLSDWPHDQPYAVDASGFHIIGGYLAYAPIGVLGDFAEQVEVKQVAGPTTAGYGIAFRHSSYNRYEFDIQSRGDWYILQDINGKFSDLIAPTSNSAIHTGLNAKNTLMVRARGDHFEFFINGAKVGEVDDSAHPSGQVGLDGDDHAEVVFSNLLITALS
ncbi:MAG TPA: family 16 glycoside hydrolase [Ktedonobacterales bacterium]